MYKIVIVKRTSDYMAYFDGFPEQWENNEDLLVAIASLLIHRKSLMKLIEHNTK